MTMGQLDEQEPPMDSAKTPGAPNKCSERWLMAEVSTAMRRGRATLGAAAAAEILERTGGGGVRLCVLGGGAARGLAHLQLVLIEAFCREAGVPVARLPPSASLPAPVLLLHDAALAPPP